MNALDIHLKFPDEATATRLLLAAGLLQQVDGQIFQAQGKMVDIIGLIHKPNGVMLIDQNGNQYPKMVDVGGWHVNIRGELPNAIAQYKITVTGTPYRIWD